MHILASGPELQAVYFEHVIQTGSGEKRLQVQIPKLTRYKSVVLPLNSSLFLGRHGKSEFVLNSLRAWQIYAPFGEIGYP